MKTVRYVIEQDGGIFRVLTDKVPITVLPSIAKQFQNQVTFKIIGLMDFDNPFYGATGLVIGTASPDLLVWSTRVRSLNLNTKWVLGSNKILFPDFQGLNNGVTELTLQWTPPDSMRLMVGFTVLKQAHGWLLQQHYLVAYDKEGRTWKLPLSNLHDHLEVCHGQDLNVHPSALKAVQVGLEAFRVSEWNDHLTGHHRAAHAEAMFGFSPDNEGFKQRPVKEPWTDYCAKVANEFIITNMMPL